MDATEREQKRLQTTFIQPQTVQAHAIEKLSADPIVREYSLMDLLKRPEITYDTLMKIADIGPGIANSQAAEQIQIQAKYAGYIDRQLLEIEKQRRHEDTPLANDFNYDQVKGLSNEVLQKLKGHRPVTVGQASRISGVTPAAISLLLIHLKKTKVIAA